MAEHRNKKPQDVGSESPASESAKQQRIAGTRGGPRASGESPRTEKQPPQTSNRRGARHEPDGTVRRGYEAAQDPERQGDGDPGPDRISRSSSMQGHAGHGGRGRAAANEDVVER